MSDKASTHKIQRVILNNPRTIQSLPVTFPPQGNIAPKGGKAYQRRRWTTANLKNAIRPANWEKLKGVLHGLRARFGKANVIPAHLRPWVPHVRETLERGGPEAIQITEELRKTTTRGQWRHLQKQFPTLKHNA